MKKIYNFYLLTFVLLSDFAMFAQPGSEDTGGTGGLQGGDPAPAPINGKLILLAIMGVLFVMYTFRKNKETV